MAIMEKLRREGIHVKITQLNNFLKTQRRKQNGPSQFTLQDLVDWASARTQRPDDDNKVFVAKYEYTTEPDRQFKIFLTTKRLVRFTIYVNFSLSC